MIIDFAKIYVKAGNGGEGASTKLFLSSRRVIGGGGNGGNGGDVILEVSPHLYDLSKFKEKRKFIAQNGSRGEHNNRKGKSGQDLILAAPLGTVVWSLDKQLIVDLKEPGQKFVVCRAGKGGEGNFKKLYTLPPQAGEEKEIYLDYRICADVAVIGFANSGKTSLVNKLAGKNFKVADYPFTTQFCAWAKAGSFLIMDTPPLRKNALERGFSNDFLKHLERPRIIIVLSDNLSGYKEEFTAVKREILSFDENLFNDKKVFYLINKTDTIDKTPKIKSILLVSVKTGKGIEELKKKIAASL